MYQVEYKGRFYSRLKTHDEKGVLIEHVGLTQSDVEEINRQHDWVGVRNKRDVLIAETDYTQMSDSPLTAEQKQAFADYRQALRDIPQTYSDPDDVVWPDKPAI